MESNIDHNGNLTQVQFENLSKALMNLAETIQSLYNPNTIHIISDTLSAFSDRLTDIYGDGIEGYKEWGKLGWSFSPSINPDMFRNAPKSTEEANKTMQVFMTEEELSKIVCALKSAEVNQEELDEAEACFKSGAYNACALLLFGIIDNRLFQYGFTGKRSKHKILIGKSAAECLEKEHKLEGYYFYMKFLNITTALKTIFDFGNNFEKDMIIINRNYLSHGMAGRSISKLECFQIWCLAFSSIVYIDILDECCNETYELK